MENDDAYFICDAAFGDGVFNGEPGVLAGFRGVFTACAGFFVQRPARRSEGNQRHNSGSGCI